MSHHSLLMVYITFQYHQCSRKEILEQLQGPALIYKEFMFFKTRTFPDFQGLWLVNRNELAFVHVTDPPKTLTTRDAEGQMWLVSWDIENMETIINKHAMGVQELHFTETRRECSDEQCMLTITTRQNGTFRKTERKQLYINLFPGDQK